MAWDWESFHLSWRHMELNADTTFLEKYVNEWDRARTPQQKMAPIDGVIHRWHHETKLAERGGVGRPLGVNLIEGRRKQIIAFLDNLSSGQNHDRWKQFSDEVPARTHR